MIVIAVLDAAVGDGDAMGVAPEIGEYLRRSAKRLLGVNDPIDALRGGQTGGERIGIGQMREIAEEAEGLRVEGLLQAFDEKAAEEFCERLDGEKEVRSPGDPARPIGRETAAWHERNARVDDASASAPTCAEQRRRRSVRRASAGWRRASSSLRPTPRTGSRRRRPCSGTRGRRSARAM